MSCQLLLVDDEPNVPKAIRRALRKQGYAIHIASSGAEALELLERQAIDVILSDHQMPGMTGAELLSAVSTKHPSIVNIMLSGQADMTVVVDALNDGNIYKFLHKPWSTEALRTTVAEAAEVARTRAQANDSRTLSEKQFCKLITTDIVGENASLILFELRNASELRNAGDLGSHPEYTSFLNDLIAQLSRVGDEYLGETLLPLQMLEGNLMAAVLCDFDTLSVENFFRALSSAFSSSHTVHPSISLGYANLLPDVKRSFSQALSALTSTAVGNGTKYSKSVADDARLRRSLTTDLFQALENREFYLNYQPQVCAETERIRGVESLCRWQHPREGFVSPEIFIGLAEQTGFINQLGLWVMEQACLTLRELQLAGASDVRLSLNVSPKQFSQRAWVDFAIEFISQQKFSASLLELEITESSIMADAGQALEILTELRKHGVRIAMDDFGTGHSSLGQINQLPIDVLKLDRSLIMDIEHSVKSETLLRNLLSLAKDLGLETIAEGVETSIQADICKQYGCDLIQGYYYHRPMSFEHLAELCELRA